jgi:4-hydroxythreonine-4-phosphate dehydrogenase
MGDPAGVGPELCLRALAAPEVLGAAVPVVFGDAGVLARVAERCGLGWEAEALTRAEWNAGREPAGPAAVVDCAAIAAGGVRPGEIRAECGSAAFEYIREGIRAALSGRIVGVATAPIHKEALHLAGIPYPGHTEMFADLTGAKRTCMMLASEEITVSLVTIHTALERVPQQITTARVREAIELTHDVERRLGRAAPRIVVCGLNPHAGEHGLFGREEVEQIAPAVEWARERGWAVEGPMPPDTAFLPGRRAQTDAYVAMYHDQGLIPFKMLAFDRGVNITLGLPIVRTSVDHGTAFDIAWQGKASARSLIESVLWAVRLAGAPAGARPSGAQKTSLEPIR